MKRRQRSHCVACGAKSGPIVCERCRVLHKPPSTSVLAVYPLAMRRVWPDIGVGATVARSFRESA